MKGLIASVFLLAFGLPAGAQTPLREPVFTAPADYVDSAPPGPRTCARGMQSTISQADFRRLAVRNGLWQQEEGVDLSRESWSTGHVVHKPTVDFRTADGARRRFMAEVHVLVGSDGQVLDKRVACSSDPAYNEDLLKTLDLFAVEPSRYKGRGLNTLIPVNYDL